MSAIPKPTAEYTYNARAYYIAIEVFRPPKEERQQFFLLLAKIRDIP
jgi:hypothetical protein